MGIIIALVHPSIFMLLSSDTNFRFKFEIGVKENMYHTGHLGGGHGHCRPVGAAVGLREARWHSSGVVATEQGMISCTYIGWGSYGSLLAPPKLDFSKCCLDLGVSLSVGGSLFERKICELLFAVIYHFLQLNL
jgi:hypothetical protein